MGSPSSISLEILADATMRHHRVYEARTQRRVGSLALWSSVCKGWIEQRVRRCGQLRVVLNLSCMETAVGECIVELGLYSHWSAQRVAVGELLRSAHVIPVKEIKAKLYRMVAKSRFELVLYKVIGVGRGDGSTNGPSTLVVRIHLRPGSIGT